MSENAGQPAVAKIFVVDTPDSANQGYFSQCLTYTNKVPYINEQGGSKIALITEYDQNRRVEIKPGGRFYDELLGHIQGIVDRVGCNLIYWSSENSFCKKYESVLSLLERELPINDKPTVVLLTACNTDESAFAYNTDSTKKIKYGNSPSQEPLFLGYDGQIHRYKSNIFICKHPLTDFDPTMCNGAPLEETYNGQEVVGRDDRGQRVVIADQNGRITAAARASTNELVKCCVAMNDGFSAFFIKQLSGDRHCTKVDWGKLEERVRNILTKKDARSTISLEDSTIRAFNPKTPTAAFDGVYCKSKKVNNPDPCNLQVEPMFNYTAASRYITEKLGEKRHWGKLMANLRDVRDVTTNPYDYGTRGKNFFSILGLMSEADQKRFVNTKDRMGRTALFMIFSHGNLYKPNDKKLMVNKLIELGADTNGVVEKEHPYVPIHRQTSLNELLFNKEDNRDMRAMIADILLRKKVNILMDPIFMAKKQFSEGNSNPEKESIKGKIQSIEDNLKQYAKEILAKIKNTARNKNEAKELLRRAGIKYNAKFKEILDSTDLEEISPEEANTAIITLSSEIPMRNGSRKQLYTFILESIQNLTATVQPKNIIPLPDNVAPTANGGRRKQTKKNRRSKRRQTRRR